VNYTGLGEHNISVNICADQLDSRLRGNDKQEESA